MPHTPRVRVHRANLGGLEAGVQAAAMMARRLLGTSIAEIAAEFGVSLGTVSSRLQLARESGVLPQAQTIILEKLLPLAVATYHHALTDEQGDPELRLKAAKDILLGTAAIQSKATVVHESDPESLEAFRAERARLNSIPGEIIPQTPLEEAEHVAKRLGA